MSKLLVAYFSRTNKSKALAEVIAKKCEADLFAIEPVKEYSSNYILCVGQAKIEHFQNARPAMKQELNNLKDYDKVVLVFPIWWFTCPNIILAFLEKYAKELKGKTILPVCTFDGSGKGASEPDMAKACPEAKFLPIVQVKKPNKELNEDIGGMVAMVMTKGMVLTSQVLDF